jgi:hypothetical protein
MGKFSGRLEVGKGDGKVGDGRGKIVGGFEGFEEVSNKPRILPVLLEDLQGIFDNLQEILDILSIFPRILSRFSLNSLKFHQDS